MNRKMATWSLGIMIGMVLLAWTIPASATFTQDTMVLKGTTDTSARSGTDTEQLMDVATDSGGTMYILHVQTESSYDSTILITKLDKNGTFSEVVSVANELPTSPTSPVMNNGLRAVRRASLAVNAYTGAIYVAVANESSAFLYYDTDADDWFDSTIIPDFYLQKMDRRFGFIDVAVWGGSASDSVFVIGAVDTGVNSGYDSMSFHNQTGIKLWRFGSNGTLKTVDSQVIQQYVRADSSIAESDSVALDRYKIPSNASLVAIGSNALGIVFQGVITSRDTTGEALDSVYLRRYRHISPDTVTVDTGTFYDTILIVDQVPVPNSVDSDVDSNVRVSFRIVSDTHIGRIANSVQTDGSDTDGSITAFFDRKRGKVVVYMWGRTRNQLLSRIELDTGTQYSSSAVADVGTNLSIAANDSVVIAIGAGSDVLGYEYVVLRLKSGENFYIRRLAGSTSATNIDFDTVADFTDLGADTKFVGILVTAAGSPRVFIPRTAHGDRIINVGRPEALALTTTSITVSNSVQTTSTTAASTPSVTLTILPPVNDASTPQFSQVVLSQPSSSNVTTGTLTDFTTPTYQVTAPLGNLTGDTLICDINSTIDGVSLYMRRPEDTTPSGGTNAYDTNMFGGLTDSQILVLAGTMVKLRIGDTAGNVTTDANIGDSGIAVRVKFQLTAVFLQSLAAAGIETDHLSVWKATGSTLSTTNDFAEVGATYTRSDIDDGNGFLLTSNAITSFSFIVVAPGGSSTATKNSGICVIGRHVGGQSVVAQVLREVRDMVMSTKVGRVLASIYYQF